MLQKRNNPSPSFKCLPRKRSAEHIRSWLGSYPILFDSLLKVGYYYISISGTSIARIGLTSLFSGSVSVLGSPFSHLFQEMEIKMLKKQRLPKLEHMSKWARNKRLYPFLKSLGYFVEPVCETITNRIEYFIVSSCVPDYKNCPTIHGVDLFKRDGQAHDN